MSAPATVTMVNSDRMAGPIAVWGSGATPKGTTVDQAATAGAVKAAGGRAYGFGDLLDIVNPLQHIPVVSDLYRHVTGDAIKPVSQVLGDTLYGGFLGGIGSLVNEIATNATGHDLAGDALALVKGKGINFRPVPGGSTASDDGLLAREQADDQTKDNATVLRYSDLGGGKREVWERVNVGGDRMAGTMVRIREDDSGVPNVVVPVGQTAANQTAASQAVASQAPAGQAASALSPNIAVPTRT